MPRLIDNAERRARLARRHAIHPAHRVDDPVAATTAMTVLHATEASSVHLSIAARTDRVSAEQVDGALYADRSLVKQLAMRRTLFVLPRDLLPATLGSAAARVAGEQERLLLKDLSRHGIGGDDPAAAHAWLAAASSAVVQRLATGEALTARQLREELPELSGSVGYALHKDYGGQVNIAPRVLTMLGAQGVLVRGTNAGHWRISRPAWTLMESWLGEAVRPLPTADGYAELVRRWLRTFGPGTEADLVWWLGSTKSAVRAALAQVGASPVALQDDRVGWVLPDDEGPEPGVEPWAALLPTLDPTTMGWREREFYLDPAITPYLFDSNGNGGTTAWWDGRIVGAWVQDPDGVVRVVLAPGVDVGAEAGIALEQEAERLTSWLDGVVITNVYKSALMTGTPLP